MAESKEVETLNLRSYSTAMPMPDPSTDEDAVVFKVRHKIEQNLDYN